MTASASRRSRERVSFIDRGSAFVALAALPPPSENELIYAVDVEPPVLDQSSGVDITDPGELLALRAARDVYLEIGWP
jgi:hypothetical protein